MVIIKKEKKSNFWISKPNTSDDVFSRLTGTKLNWLVWIHVDSINSIQEPQQVTVLNVYSCIEAGVCRLYGIHNMDALVEVYL